MRVPAALMVMCVVTLAAAPAFALNHTVYEDCSADDPDRNIVGCSSIIDDRGESATNRAHAYVRRALAYDSKGDFDRAIADFTDAISLGPDNFRAYAARGGAWYFKGELDRAISDFDQAIRSDPEDAFAYHMRGVAMIDKNDPKRAIADFTDAIRFNPRDVIAYDDRARAWRTLGEPDRAIDDLTKAIEIDPSPANDINGRHINFYVTRGNAWTAPSPTSIRPLASTRRTPTPTAIADWLGSPRKTTTVASPTSAKRSVWTRNSAPPTTSAGSHATTITRTPPP
jgi:tetratricopeptide (TPR) repeat protein